MGVWDLGPFDNDAAEGFILDLCEMSEADATAEICSVMNSVVKNNDYVDRAEMSAAIAGAALVAKQIDPSLPLPETVEEAMAGKTFNVEGLRDLANRVFRRADDPDNNDWYDQRCGDFEGFKHVEAKNGPYRRVLEG
ncbi:hypothetical protein FQN54_006827 [Arachnomyces sp. PD_36]|nr:hypothetical protein FQN54_006827 [Arachnomyces sp. PD_36]